MDTLAGDVRFAVRALRRRPGTSAAIVATLALGIGANTAVFSVVGAVLLRSLPYPEPERLVRIWESGPRGDQRNVAEANFADWKERSRSFEGLALYVNQGQSISGGREPVRAQAASVTRGFFDVLGVRPLLGRTLSAEDARPEAPPVAVVGYGFWQRVLGGETDLSRLQLRFANATHAVVGVMPQGFSFPPQAEVWAPREIRWPFNPSRSSHNFAAVGRLRPGVPAAAASAELGGMVRAARRQFGEREVGAVDTRVLPLLEALTGQIRPALLALTGAVGLLLLVACANVANLMLAEAQGRLPELAVRTALGAGRARLFRQFFAEALLLSLLGGALGVATAAATLRVLLRLGEGRLPRIDEIGIDFAVLTFSLGLCVLTALLVGVLPALRLRDADTRELLKGGGRTHSESRATRRARAGLAVSQLALTLTLLVGAGLLGKSLAELLRADLGFQKDGRVVVDVVLPPLEGPEGRARLAAFHERFEEKLQGLPGVSASGGVTHLPLSGREANGAITLEDRNDRSYYPSYRACSPGYFGVMGIPLLRGRLFDARDGPGAPHVAVVSETAARRAFAGQDPLGRRFQWGNMDGDFDDWITVVGVVRDVQHQGPQGRANGEIYLATRQRPHRTATYTHVLRGGADLRTLGPAVRDAARALDPDVTLDVRPLDDVYKAHLADRRFSVSLIAGFAGTALGLALLGLYGVMISTVTSRTQEIGIRMALGAHPGDVVRLLLGDASRMTALGVGLGVAGALAIGRALEGLLHGVSAVDPATFAGVSAFLGASALGAAWLPARRAAQVDPILTLQGVGASQVRAAAEQPPSDPARLERKARDLLAEVAQEARAARSAEEVLELATQHVRGALGATTLAVLVGGSDGRFACVGRPGLGLDKGAFVARRLRRLDAPLRLEGKDLDAWQHALDEDGFQDARARQAEIDTLRELDAALVAPLALKGEFLGLLVAGPRGDGRRYAEEDDELAMAVAAQMALVLENARLLARVARQERLERELQMAALVQERLLPARAPVVAGLDLHGVCLPARGVAGDYFDFVARSDGSLAVTLADVAGKGMPAALLMSGLRAAVRAVAKSPASTPADVLRAVNEVLLESGDGASYATVFQAHFAPGARTLTYANAGHCPPLLVRLDGGIAELSVGGMVAGLFADASFEEARVALESGDLLVAHTDGLSEAVDAAGEEYGAERVQACLRGAGVAKARDVSARLLRDVGAFAGGAEPHDDLTLVAVRVL